MEPRETAQALRARIVTMLRRDDGMHGRVTDFAAEQIENILFDRLRRIHAEIADETYEKGAALAEAAFSHPNWKEAYRTTAKMIATELRKKIRHLKEKPSGTKQGSS